MVERGSAVYRGAGVGGVVGIENFHFKSVILWLPIGLPTLCTESLTPFLCNE